MSFLAAKCAAESSASGTSGRAILVASMELDSARLESLYLI